MEFPDLSDMLDVGYSLKPPMEWPVYAGGELKRNNYMTASEAHLCSRRIKFRQQSKPVPFRDWGYAERGHMIEQWAVPLIRDGLAEKFPEYRLLLSGRDQRSFVSGDQSGTPDGVLIHISDPRSLALDIKSVDPRTNYDNLPKPEHVTQLIQNIDLINRSPMPHNVVGGIIFYIDASNLQRRKYYLTRETHDDRAMELRDKAAKIKAAKSPEDLPPEGMFIPGECKRCPFGGRCSALVEATNADAELLKQHERAMNVGFRKP